MENGYKVLADAYNEIVGVIPHLTVKTAEDFKAEADESGYTRIQVWEFMQKFVPVTSIASPLYFDLEVLFEKGDLKPVEKL